MLLTSLEDTRRGKTLGSLSLMNPKEENQDPWRRLLVRLYKGPKLRWSRLHSRYHSLVRPICIPQTHWPTTESPNLFHCCHPDMYPPFSTPLTTNPTSKCSSTSLVCFVFGPVVIRWPTRREEKVVRVYGKPIQVWPPHRICRLLFRHRLYLCPLRWLRNRTTVRNQTEIARLVLSSIIPFLGCAVQSYQGQKGDLQSSPSSRPLTPDLDNDDSPMIILGRWANIFMSVM